MPTDEFTENALAVRRAMSLKMERAALMYKIPLIDLHKLIAERQIYAIEGDVEKFENINQMIRDLLIL